MIDNALRALLDELNLEMEGGFRSGEDEADSFWIAMSNLALSVYYLCQSQILGEEEEKEEEAE